ncbi:hypothetical protein LPB140_03525 [Sphingorhabdus lutea]|uniref:GH16 domain-containing protein n=2 Tax=Sphingorhabdus lutea TaxID=1913578 RepID=A0A1L3JEI0_9SPHN|nr:hypothetical protein LPB140_03525 [Sphingorhabdus lutea]
MLPASDQDNSDGWVLNEEVSDEFNGTEIDRDKWHVEGYEGQYHHWKGRAPSQFAGHNAYLKDGKLNIRTQWEPDFKFASDKPGGVAYGDPLPVTTAAVIGKKRFLNGYMEARTKAGNASMTSAFWALGYQSELDVYEQIGNPKNKKGNIRETHYTSAIHDWRPNRYEAQFGKNKTFTNTYDMGVRVADDFHIYGVEWNEDYLKFYLDGKLTKEISRREIGDGWVLSNPMAIWFDSEIFEWLGNPHKEELPAIYEIDYVRIWQKRDANMVDKALFGFEGPIVPDDFITDVSTDVARRKKGDALQNWNIGKVESKFFSLDQNRYFNGYRSLKIQTKGPLPSPVVTMSSPKAAVAVPKGRYRITMRVWVQPGSTLSAIGLGLPQGKVGEIITSPIHISAIEKGRWIEVAQTFEKKNDASPDDVFTVSIMNKDVGDGTSEIYLDDIIIRTIGP